MVMHTSRSLAGLGAVCLLVLLTAMSIGCKQEQQSGMVRWSDIPKRAEIIGKLGLPLGELVTVHGGWTAPPPQKAALPVFVVDRVNGRPLDPRGEFDDMEPVDPTLRDDEFAKREVGEGWELRGVETGGFVGFSEEVMASTGLPPMQPGPHGSLSFQTSFRYVKARRIPGSTLTEGAQD
jgi:hypothetical protein